jgi:hypothetical protein
MVGQNPTIDWARFSGGAGSESPLAITKDKLNNIYSVGYFTARADFDPGVGSQVLTPTSTSDAFIQKLDPNGNLLWAKAILSSNTVEASSVVTDSLLNVYITGHFYGTADFDPGPNSYSLTSNNLTSDIYILKLDQYGNFLWAKTFGSFSEDKGHNITVDTKETITIVGHFIGTVDFDPGPSSHNLTSIGNANGFVLKLDTNGGFIWVKNTFKAFGYKITSDIDGNSYMAGFFSDTVDINPNTGVHHIISNGLSDIFLLKLDKNGNFLWNNSYGGPNSDGISAIHVGKNNKIYISGIFQDSVDFDPSSSISYGYSNGDYDYFIQQLDTSGNLIWNHTFGGQGFEDCYGITTDSVGNIYTTGIYQLSVDFDPGVDSIILNSKGFFDVYSQKFDLGGNLLWAISYGGLYFDCSYGIEVDDNNNIYMGGFHTGVADFDPSTDSLYNTSLGGQDVFILKLNQVLNSSLSYNQQPSTFKIYPNPTFDILNIETHNQVSKSIQILNLNGVVLYDKTTSSKNTTIDVKRWLSGVYFLNIKSKQNTQTKVFIINNNGG